MHSRCSGRRRREYCSDFRLHLARCLSRTPKLCCFNARDMNFITPKILYVWRSNDCPISHFPSNIFRMCVCRSLTYELKIRNPHVLLDDKTGICDRMKCPFCHPKNCTKSISKVNISAKNKAGFTPNMSRISDPTIFVVCVAAAATNDGHTFDMHYEVS